jgi:uncharacterized phosphosugar-binding protein
MSAERYLRGLTERLERISQTQLPALHQAADLCAQAIAGGALVHLFGTGHGTLPALEAFPRTGSFVGWHPIVVEAVGPVLRIGGDGSVHQFRCLQGTEEFGAAILESYPIHPGDPFLISSHSGVNRVVVEVALGVKARSCPLIAITSLEHSLQASPRHSSGKKLYELADIVIDSFAPFGDASVEIQGLDQRVAAVSTPLATAIIGALVAQTAMRLVELGHQPLVLGHIDRRGQSTPDEMRRDYVQALQDRLWRR